MLIYMSMIDSDEDKDLFEGLYQKSVRGFALMGMEGCVLLTAVGLRPADPQVQKPLLRFMAKHLAHQVLCHLQAWPCKKVFSQQRHSLTAFFFS